LETRHWQKNYDFDVPTTIRYPRFPVQNLVHIAATYFPHKASTSFYGTELTYRQIRSQMLRMANALIKLGLKKGDRVGMALPNCPQYVITYYAILSAGGIVVNMNPLYTHDELKFMMENSGIQTLVTFDAALPTMRPLAKELGLKRVIVTKVSDYIKGSGVSDAKSLGLEKDWLHFSDLIAGSIDERVPRIDFKPQDPAMIQFTGGTTGLPKGALLSHGNIIAATFISSQWGRATSAFQCPFEQTTVICVIPYFHIYGNIICMNWSMLNVCTQIMIPRFDLEEFMGVLGSLPVISFFPSVPTMITAIVNHPKVEELKLGERIRLINSGGAPMPVELIQRVKDLGIYFGEGWGMSETTALGISNPVLAPKVGAIGIPVMDTDVRLVDVETGAEDVNQGEPGEIIIKGPTVMQGYWNNPAETANQMTDGWLHTGDIGQMDEDGYISIVDRKKDMIIAGGFNIYPREVDEVLYQHPKIAECVTVGVPDPYRGETVKVFLVLKPNETATDKEIITFCKEKLAPYKVPKLIEFRESIPKSAVGKILRKILRDEEIAKMQK
jgi:long-chain acyl-CoA synthetase